MTIVVSSHPGYRLDALFRVQLGVMRASATTAGYAQDAPIPSTEKRALHKRQASMQWRKSTVAIALELR